MAQATIKLKQPSRLRLVDGVYQSLEDAILSGSVRPGERLIETSIAGQLGVGRSTVREAFLMLQRRGLVTTIPRRGTFVTRISRSEALDLARTRSLLEGFAVVIGFERIDDDLLATLDARLDQMRACVLPGDLPRLIRIDLEFHRALVEHACSPRLLDTWDSLSGQIGSLYIRGVEEQRFTGDDIVRIHQRLLDAVRGDSPVEALRAVVDHYVRSDDAERRAISAAIEATVAGLRAG